MRGPLRVVRGSRLTHDWLVRHGLRRPLLLTARPQGNSAVIFASRTSLHYFPGQIGGLRGPIKRTLGRWLNSSQLEVTLPLKSYHDPIGKGVGGKEEGEGERGEKDKGKGKVNPIGQP